MPLSRLAYALRRRLCVPDVIVDFVNDEENLFVTIENIGTGPAHAISVSFEPDLQGVRGTVKVSALRLFDNLSFLPPGREVRTFLDVTPAYFDRDEPTDISVTVRFENDGGTRFTRHLKHDLSVHQNTSPPPSTGESRSP